MSNEQPTDQDRSPEEIGRERANAIASDADAFERVADIWATPYGPVGDRETLAHIFFPQQFEDESREERAELLVLLERLGLEREPVDKWAKSGEVWVKDNDRLNQIAIQRGLMDPEDLGDEPTSEFRVSDEQGNEETLSLERHEESGGRVLGLVEDWKSEAIVIEDVESGETLRVSVRDGALARSAGGDSNHTEFALVSDTNRPYRTTVSGFLGDGYSGLDYARWWVSDESLLRASASERGEALARSVDSDEAAVELVMRIWADSGIVDSTDEHFIFFEGHDVDDDELERAALNVLIAKLGLEKAQTPPGNPSGEVWVRMDPRLDAEAANWS